MSESHETHDVNRRQLLKLSVIGAAVIPLSTLLANKGAQAQDLPKLEESDPAAQALGYVHDAAQTDTAKFPKRASAEAANQFCKNCQLYTGADGEEWGPCSIFPGKVVNANGWCNAWVQKQA